MASGPRQLDLFGFLKGLVAPQEPTTPPASPRATTPRPEAPPQPHSPRAAPPRPTLPAAPTPPRGPSPSIVFDGVTVPYQLRRSRRRTIGLRIGDEGLCVTAPTWVASGEIERVLRERREWILRHLQAWRERTEHLRQHATRWESGSSLPYLGVDITFQTSGAHPTRYGGDVDAPAPGDVLWLALPADAAPERLRDSVQAWLRQRAQEVLGQRLQQALQHTGLSITGWRLSSAHTRWGSCNSKGQIRLNWRLVHFAPHLIDYVIIHELAHLREMNHGPDFWAQVETLMPDYRAARQALRAIDPGSLPIF